MPGRGGAKCIWQFYISVKKIPITFHVNIRCLLPWNHYSFCPLFTTPQCPSHKPKIIPKKIYYTFPYNNLSLENFTYLFDCIAMLCNKSCPSVEPILLRLLSVDQFMNRGLYPLSSFPSLQNPWSSEFMISTLFLLSS